LPEASAVVCLKQLSIWKLTLRLALLIVLKQQSLCLRQAGHPKIYTKGKDKMNRIYKTVWNAVRRCLVVVNEAAMKQGNSTLGGGGESRS
jgi:hypothetical protein